MCKLVLNKGDTVRNIRQGSSRKGQIGTVTETSYTHYRVTYANGIRQDYLKDLAHLSLEKLVTAACLCQQPLFKVVDLNSRDCSAILHEINKRGTPDYIIAGANTTLGIERQGKRRVLKKVRRNVLNGKTQEEYVRDMGYARGVEQFNTRALGKSTGQALHAIGSAMMNPGTEIRISKIDHAREQPGCSTSWTTLDKHFRLLVQSLIGNMKGFTFTDTHIVFNPIVTEETYVEL